MGFVHAYFMEKRRRKRGISGGRDPFAPSRLQFNDQGQRQGARVPLGVRSSVDAERAVRRTPIPEGPADASARSMSFRGRTRALPKPFPELFRRAGDRACWPARTAGALAAGPRRNT